MTEDQAPLDPKGWRSWSKSQRLEYVQRFRIMTPQMKRVWDDFDTAVRLARQLHLSEPYWQFLAGASGTGKTTLVQMWRERVAPDVPSLYAAIPAPNSVKNYITECLTALGDPEPWRGTTGQMAWRLTQAIKAAEIRIIFLDEMQHLFDRTGSPASVRTSEDVLSFISNLTNDLNLPLVLIGLPEEADMLLQISPKLGPRMQAPSMLDSFGGDFSRPKTNQGFRILMHTIDQILPLDWSDLGTEETAFRFFCATDGVLRPLMRLVRSAACQAIEEDTPTLTMEILAEAYERVLANTGMRRGKSNPFSGPLR